MASNSNHATIPMFEEANEVPANWSLAHESHFIELMLDKVQASGENKQTGTFSKHDWTDIRKQYYEKFRLKYDLKAFKNKFTKLKERYKDHKKLVEDNTGLGWDPILCTVDASNEWWDDHVKNFPRDKLFRTQGCPKYGKLVLIFGDTVATGHLRQTQDGGFSSTDEDEINTFEGGVTQTNPTLPLDRSTQFSGYNGAVGDQNEGNIDNQFRGRSRAPIGSSRSAPSFSNSAGLDDVREDNVDDRFRQRSRTPVGSSRRGRKDNKANEIGESLKLLAENAKDKLEDKTKYSISECLELLDSMGTRVGGTTYVKAVKVLQDKGWRETFIKMSEGRRSDWIESIEGGEF
ncbi:hypothetical protein MKW94_007493 [Papaver nudicaule]|uniref:Myb/SANT-like domain-containing protein n=1 Tax=Papaver nudicaule TaxID=74823 RepID=A0AA41RXM8_PAPNU|nr:hypothetical protein [Papaver nudicaule]